MDKLHIDIETYSSIDIRQSGSYRYFESEDFEILLVAYAFNEEPVEIVDLASGEKLPSRFIKAMKDQNTKKFAHNANFERNAFKNIGLDVPIEQWYCTSVKAGYCGLPLNLDGVSKALGLGDKAKLSTGKSLIRFFCVPRKPTKKDARTRNTPIDDLSKWEQFKTYCIQDVEAEREVENLLSKYEIPQFERDNYILDQEINDRGVEVDLLFAANATDIDSRKAKELKDRVIELTGVENPNSTTQLKKWLFEETGKEIESLSKTELPILIEEATSADIIEVLKIRSKSSKTSVKKYQAILNCACQDNRIRGLLQFYGANRTGRWAGRLVQVQNLPRNYLKDLELAREVIKSGDYDLACMLFGNVPDILSQLVRTAFIPRIGTIFGVADFSAIEARVIAWLCGEKWRIDVFNSHGKIYEASASMMFGIPIEQITKGSEYRNKGKIAELALGYQGGVGALKTMGGEAMGLSEEEMSSIVTKWRSANKKIARFWKDTELNAKRALRTRKKISNKFNNLHFFYDGKALTIELPSGRKLFYQSPSLYEGKFGTSIRYKGLDQTTKQWRYIDTYGGKLVENIVQAVARDLLANSMQNLENHGFDIVMHVHDEVICEILDRGVLSNESELINMCQVMSMKPSWAEDLPLDADGYLTRFYKKD